jgi:hypothetical protein
MKKTVVSLLFAAVAASLHAQEAPAAKKRFRLSVVAGANVTFAPDVERHVIITGAAVVPGVFSPSNSVGFPTAEKSKTSTKSMAGWNVATEANLDIGKSYSLSFAAGVKALRVQFGDDYYLDHLPSGNWDNIEDEYGTTKLLCVSVGPFMLNRSFLSNRVTIGIGPSLDFLVKKEIENMVLVFNTQESRERNTPTHMFFDTLGDFEKSLLGLNASVGYQLLPPLAVRITAQKYVTSLFSSNGLYSEYGSRYQVPDTKPMVVQFSLVFDVHGSK